jgi:arsenate reductase-like glutaredoxin family protein
VAFTSRDIFKQPLSEAEIRSLAGNVPVSDLFSWKSPTARQRGLTPGALDEDALLRLMAGEPRLIRRPLVVSDGRLVIGADLKQLAELAQDA